MRQDQAVALLGAAVLFIGLASCTATERTPAGRAKVAASAAEVPVIPDEPPVGQEAPSPEASGEVQERGVAPKVMKPGLTSPQILVPMQVVPIMPGAPAGLVALPGEFAMRTQKGYYLTAINGGGRTADPIVITSATSAGSWEKFRVAVTNPSSPHDKVFQTASGNYLTAVNGGGMTANVLHTDATQANDWERYRLLDQRVGNYAIQTIKGYYVTAVGAGGRYQDAIHTDAKQIQAWEQFRVVKCGDLGSGYEYGIMAADGEFLYAGNGGGQTKQAISLRSLSPPLYAEPKWASFKFLRQADGSYALQVSNGMSFLTALGGGGQAATIPNYTCHFWAPCIGPEPTDIFHTDATQVRAWEKFRFVDQGNCTYTIQTASSFYVGIYSVVRELGARNVLTTNRSTISGNEKFQLVVYDLASPVVLQ